jgi:hypothetical protein
MMKQAPLFIAGELLACTNTSTLGVANNLVPPLHKLGVSACPQDEKDHSHNDTTTEEISSGIIGQTASAETTWHQACPNQAIFNPIRLSLAGQTGFVTLVGGLVFSGTQA